MRGFYRGLALAVAALVALQAAFIAYFISGLGKWIQQDGGVLDASVFAEGSTVEVGGEAGIALHAISGTFVIPLVALILVIMSFFAKIPGGTKWALIVFGVVVLQYALAFFARLGSVPLLGALHGLNALILFGVAVTAAMRVRTAGRAEVRDTADRCPSPSGRSRWPGVRRPAVGGSWCRSWPASRSSHPWSSCGRPAWCRRTSRCTTWAIRTTAVRRRRRRVATRRTTDPGARSVETLVADPARKADVRVNLVAASTNAHRGSEHAARFHRERHLSGPDHHRRAGSAGRGASTERVGAGRRGAALARARRTECDGRRRGGDPGCRAGRWGVRLPLRRRAGRHLLVPLASGVSRAGDRRLVRSSRHLPCRCRPEGSRRARRQPRLQEWDQDSERSAGEPAGVGETRSGGAGAAGQHRQWADRGLERRAHTGSWRWTATTCTSPARYAASRSP